MYVSACAYKCNIYVYMYMYKYIYMLWSTDNYESHITMDSDIAHDALILCGHVKIYIYIYVYLYLGIC